MNVEIKFPGLLPEEKKIWIAFLERYPDVYYKVDYNVRVGKGVSREGAPEDKWSGMYRTLTKKRIDAVGHTDGEIHIIEIRPRIELPNLGRLVGYRDLYIEEYRPEKDVKMVCVCEIILPDDRDVFERENVKIYELGVV